MIKGKPPRLSRVFSDSPLYFLTCCTLYRHAVLANDAVHESFRRYGNEAIKHNVAVGRYVIMPDHLHLFVCGGPEFRLGTWVRGLKRAINSVSGDWQPGFFDHVLRSDESYAEKWEYVRQNPVRANLVAKNDEWRFQGEIIFIDRA